MKEGSKLRFLIVEGAVEVVKYLFYCKVLIKILAFWARSIFLRAALFSQSYRILRSQRRSRERVNRQRPVPPLRRRERAAARRAAQETAVRPARRACSSVRNGGNGGWRQRVSTCHETITRIKGEKHAPLLPNPRAGRTTSARP